MRRLSSAELRLGKTPVTRWNRAAKPIQIKIKIRQTPTRKPVPRKKKQNRATISLLGFQQLSKKVAFEYRLQAILKSNFFAVHFDYFIQFAFDSASSFLTVSTAAFAFG